MAESDVIKDPIVVDLDTFNAVDRTLEDAQDTLRALVDLMAYSDPETEREATFAQLVSVSARHVHLAVDQCRVILGQKPVFTQGNYINEVESLRNVAAFQRKMAERE